jgi:hypothetical protein
MEINIQALIRKKQNPFALRTNTLDTAKRYHGCHCGVARIIESPASADKQSCNGGAQVPGGMRSKWVLDLGSNPNLTAGLRLYALQNSRPGSQRALIQAAAGEQGLSRLKNGVLFVAQPCRAPQPDGFPIPPHKRLDTKSVKTVS